MAHYVLARLKLNYGVSNMPRYNEAMKSIRQFFEEDGVMLKQSLFTCVGPLYQMFNLWEVEDHVHFERAVARLHDENVFARFKPALDTMTEIVFEEELSLLDTMPFFVTGPDDGK